MIEATSEAIARAERLAHVAFQVADAAASAALPPSAPHAHSGLADLLKHQSAIEVARHGIREAQGDLLKGIADAVGVIDSAIVTGKHLEAIADYIEGAGSLPADLDPQLSVLARSAKSAVGSGIEDGHQIAQDIRRAISSAQAELKRVRLKWGNQTESAGRIAHAKLAQQLATKCGSPQELKRASVRVDRLRAVHRHKYAPAVNTQGWRAA